MFHLGMEFDLSRLRKLLALVTGGVITVGWNVILGFSGSASNRIEWPAWFFSWVLACYQLIHGNSPRT